MSATTRPPFPYAGVAEDYWTPPALWHWSDEGAALAWTKGRATLAFTEQLAPVLERLAEDGLPPLPALLILFAHHRGWPERGRPERAALVELAEKTAGARRKGKGASTEAVAYAARWGLAEGWPEERERIAGARKPLLAAWVKVLDALDRLVASRDASPNATRDAAREVPALTPAFAHALCAPVSDWRLSPAESLEAVRRFHEATAVLAEPENRSLHAAPEVVEQGILFLYRALVEEPHARGGDAFALARRRMETGLEGAPALRVEEDVIPPALLARALMRAATTETEAGRVLRLARSMTPAARLPRLPETTRDWAAGGYSGVVNRGDPDKLILSELAHDDLMLAARVAHNEALYLRPEPPAKPHRPACRILLDTTVRMWGLPRLFGLAAALALAGTLDRRATVEAYASGPRAPELVDPLTPEGIEEILRRLLPARHAGAAAARFLAEPGDAQRVLITAEASWRDTDFQKQLPGEIPPESYVMTLERDGRFRLRRFGMAGQPLREARFDPEALLAPAGASLEAGARKEAPPVAPLPRKALRWPEIFTRPVFPLRSAQQKPPLLADHREDVGLVGWTQDRMLILWEARNQKGWGRHPRVLSASIPEGKILSIHIAGSNLRGMRQEDPLCIHLLQRRNGDQYPWLLTVDVFNETQRAVRLQGEAHTIQPKTIAWLREAVAFADQSMRLWIFGFSNGDLLSQTQVSLERHLHGRYWREIRDGQAMIVGISDRYKLREAPLPRAIQRADLRSIHDTRDGRRIYSTKQGIALGFSNEDLLWLDETSNTKTLNIQYHQLSNTLLRLVQSTGGLSSNTEWQSGCLDQVREGPFQFTPHRLPPWATGRVSPDPDRDFIARVMSSFGTGHTLHNPSRIPGIRLCQGQIHLFRRRKGRARLKVYRLAGPIANDPKRANCILHESRDLGREAEPPGWREMSPFAPVAQRQPQGYSPAGLYHAELPGGQQAWLDSRGMLHLMPADASAPQLTIPLTADCNATTACWLSDNHFFGNEAWFERGTKMEAVAFGRIWRAALGGEGR